MKKSILITEKQAQDYNSMLAALNKITKDFYSPDRLSRSCMREYGLEYNEALEMAYENMQQTAHLACKGIRPIKLEEKSNEQQ
jgi:hypothetical protein